ncbi:DUF1642 domain-containing protein [Listeria monocytogenes]
MRFKEGDKVEFIYKNKKSVGEINGVYHGTQVLSIKQSDSPVDLLFSDKAVAKVEEQELVVVPQFVADWYEQHRYKLEHSIWQYIYCWDVQKRKSDFYNFMKNDNLKPIETLIKMKDGYEVEKEPLYYVKLPYFGYVTNRMDYTLSQSKTDAVMLTESKIKRMDERYWKFAVLVEEAEGEA